MEIEDGTNLEYEDKQIVSAMMLATHAFSLGILCSALQLLASGGDIEPYCAGLWRW